MNLRDKGKRTDKEMIELYIESRGQNNLDLQKELGYCAPLADMITNMRDELERHKFHGHDRGFSKPVILVMFVVALLTNLL
jgi:hypothetical protein